MNGLYPIIRRTRRPLLPPTDPAVTGPASPVELPPTVPLVETKTEPPLAVTPPSVVLASKPAKTKVAKQTD